MDIEAAYTGETIVNHDGLAYAVLDTTKLDFNTHPILYGRKTSPTLVCIAKPGEEIITSHGKTEESRVTATGGEAIFINKLPDGGEDVFIPRNAQGIANGWEILERQYRFVGGNIHDEGAYFLPSAPAVRILHEVIQKPTVILHAWGTGNHQFLDIGATLKNDNGRITGINKNAFDATWSLADPSGRTLKNRGDSRIGR